MDDGHTSQVTCPAAEDPKRGLSLFLNATLADRRTATLDEQVAAGMVYTGIFASRPRDELGIAFGQTHVNARVAEAERLQNAAGLGPVPVQTSEYVLEAFYGVQATGWLVLRPDFQYVHQPGGVRENTDDIILGLKLLLKL